MVQLSHPYMTTGKTITLTRWTFVDKVMSLLFNMLSRLTIAFLSRSKQMMRGEVILNEAYDMSEGKEDEDQEVVRRPHQRRLCIFVQMDSRGLQCSSFRLA